MAERPILRISTRHSAQSFDKADSLTAAITSHKRVYLVYDDETQVTEKLGYQSVLAEESIASRDSGVIWRMPEGFFSILLLWTVQRRRASARQEYAPPRKAR